MLFLQWAYLRIQWDGFVTPKSSWKPPKGPPSLEVFLSEIEKEIFAVPDWKVGYSNLSQEDWQAIQSIVDDRSIVIKKHDKGHSVVVWDRYDYVAEAEKQRMATFIKMLNLPRRF